MRIISFSSHIVNFLTKLSELISPSGAYMACTMNLCRFFSSGSYSKGCKLTAKEKKEKNQRLNTHFSIYIWCPPALIFFAVTPVHIRFFSKTIFLDKD